MLRERGARPRREPGGDRGLRRLGTWRKRHQRGQVRGPLSDLTPRAAQCVRHDSSRLSSLRPPDRRRSRVRHRDPGRRAASRRARSRQGHAVAALGGAPHRRAAQGRAGPRREVPAGPRARSHAGVLPRACRARRRRPSPTAAGTAAAATSPGTSPVTTCRPSASCGPPPAISASSSAPTTSSSELEEVQDAQGDGYLMAVEGAREAFAAVARGDIRSSGFDLNGLWVPWYTAHKLFAGLRDAYRYTGNATALAIETKLRRLGRGHRGEARRCPDAEDAQHRAGRHGRSAGRPVGRYRRRALDGALAPLRRTTPSSIRWRSGEDRLSGLHGNTNIPKLIGAAARYSYTGEPADGTAARLLLGPRGEPPQLRDREPLEGRVLPRSRPSRRRSPTAARPSPATSTTCSS